MSTVEESIDVHVPVRTAYNQWTQFEEFPRFMEGVEEIRQIDDTHVHWRTKIAGVEREFDTEITEQHPDDRVAWRATQGTQHAGVVTFHHIDDGTTRVMLQMDTEPEGIVEQAGDKLGVLKRRVKGDLGRFKEMIESRGGETGAWRGDVEQHGGTLSDPAAQPRARRARRGDVVPGRRPLLAHRHGGDVLDQGLGGSARALRDRLAQLRLGDHPLGRPRLRDPVRVEQQRVARPELRAGVDERRDPARARAASRARRPPPPRRPPAAAAPADARRRRR